MGQHVSEFILITIGIYILIFYLLTNLTVIQRLTAFLLGIIIYIISFKIYSSRRKK
jgi:uncharacterized membrane protein